MSNLARRVTKLETGQPGDENIVHARAPLDWSDDRCRSRAEELVGNRFDGGDFNLSVDRGQSIDEFEVLFATTATELEQILKDIRKSPRRLSDLPDPYSATLEGKAK